MFSDKILSKTKTLLSFLERNNELKMESNDKFKKIDIKNRMCFYFDDIMKIEDFDLNYVLIDENHSIQSEQTKSFKNSLVYNISYKILIDYKPISIRFDKLEEIIRVGDGTRYYLEVKSMILFTTGVDILYKCK